MNQVTLSGRIEAIHLEDINKSAHNHTYNVGIDVRHSRVEGATQFTLPAVITVRIDKVFTGAKAEKALRPSTWGKYTVGDEVSLRVEITSPTLALLR